MRPARDRLLAERVRAACIAAARQGYEEAAVSGLCAAGAWEAALGAIQMLDLAVPLAEVDDDDGAGQNQTGV